MALLRNGSIYATTSARLSGGISYLSLDSPRRGAFINRRGWWNSEATRDAQQNAFPPGYLHPTAWLLAPVAGGGASRNRAQGTSTTTATGTMGLDGVATAAGVATTTATASVIYFAAGTAAGVATTTAAAVVGLSGSGSAAGVATTAATWTLRQAASGSAAGVATTTAARTYYQAASGSVELTTVDAGALTANEVASAVWQSAAASFDTASTMGRKVNDAGAAAAHRIELDPITGVLTVYEADGTTVRSTFNILDRNSDPSVTEQLKREPVS